MKPTPIGMIAAVALALGLPAAAQENTPPPGRGSALDRIRAEVRRMNAEGRTEREILEHMRGMIDRTLNDRPAQRPGRGDGRVSAIPVHGAPASSSA